MYDDAWYNYVPEHSNKKEYAPSRSSKHRRRESLLKQPNGNGQIQDLSEPILEALEDIPQNRGPPEATLVKRAKSYSDFYEVCTSYFTRTEGKPTIIDPSNILENSRQSPLLESRYEKYESEVLDASQDEYQLYRDQLDLSESHLDSLLDDTVEALDLLAKLSHSFKAVELQTTEFQAQCEDLLNEQKSLRNLANDVGNDLQFYAYLEPLTRRLNTATGSRLVRNDDFIDILLNLNTCIGFMDEHPIYRDSTVYKTRYSSLLERALTAAQTAVSTALRDVSIEVSKDLKSKEHNDTEEYIALYGKYESAHADLGRQLQALLTSNEFAFGQKGNELSQKPYTPQYHELFNQVVDAFIKSREPVNYVVSKNLVKFAAMELKEDADFKHFARHCVQYVFDICQNELKLIRKFFLDGPILKEYPDLSSWNTYGKYTEKLEENRMSYIKLLHSFLLPHLSNGDLHRICDLVNWLETTYLASAENDDDTSSTQEHITTAQRFLTDHLWQLSDDLFIRAAREIQYFKPSTEDLRLSARAEKDSVEITASRPPDKTIQLSLKTQEAQPMGGLSATTAFPTVKTAVTLLIMYNESIYDRPKKGDVLYEIVHQATDSLQRAATIIKRTSRIMDAHLFLIKNLMLIENLFMTHEIPDSIRQSAELDFTPIWETIRELQAQKQLFNPLAYIKPIMKGNLLPAVVDRVLDARKELEKVLVQQITAFTKHWRSRLADGNSKTSKAIAESAKELETLLDDVFQDETTKAALWKMIRSDESSYF
ncbi:Sec34-like family-domain-containing protein [Bisporella sp. PMI_857]|nr:Sec34-like family-domain-containing protein [Bisporella sp. PMI_857]